MPTQMSDDLKQQLLTLEQELRNKGVVDVKFAVDRSDPTLTAEKLAQDTIEVLKAYLNEDFVPSFGIGDSTNPATIEYFAEKCAKYESRIKQRNDEIVNNMPTATISSGLDVTYRNHPAETCPKCHSEEVEACTPATVYACGSYDYDQRPGTFKQSEPCNDFCINSPTAELDHE